MNRCIAPARADGELAALPRKQLQHRNCFSVPGAFYI